MSLITLADVKNLSPHEIQELLADAWLNIRVNEKQIWNPLLHFPPSYEENPQHYLTWLMMQPDYFSFTCQELLNISIHPIQGLTLKNLWNHKFPMLIASRGFSKSFSLALYAILRMIFLPNRKIIITGAAFRQSKIIFEYMENIWHNSPILQDMFRGNHQGPIRGVDMWTFRLGESTAKAIPIGNGEKIRGQRANDILADEFKSINREIFETVIAGFGVVSSNPIDAVKTAAAIKLAKLFKIDLEDSPKNEMLRDNQIVISGTCDYDFNHFAEYWKKWRSIIYTQGKEEELEKLFKGPPEPGFNWKDYCILRIPYNLVPDGFMDIAQIARSKASMLPEIFNMEFGTIFSKDSNGFFKRSIIESCVASPENAINIPDYGTVIFHPVLKGDSSRKYIFAVDPASERDKFAIIILELHNNHRRIVYCWTTDRKEFKERAKTGLIAESDFYAYVARKIRELMKAFPCEAIAMDSQGGGVSVLEALHDKDKLKTGEVPIWPIINPEKPADTDGEFGEHLVHIINFADAAWTSAANHGLKKDFMDKVCLFPSVDAVDYAIAMSDDEMKNRLYDTLEDCIFDINELKDELSTIVVTATPSGRERWDTPEIKLPGQKKGRLLKDRYSALLMANMVAREIQRAPEKVEHTYQIGWARDSVERKDEEGPTFIGPAWAAQSLNNLY